MNATMMNHSRRQILTGPSSNKRKERDGPIDGFNKPPSVVTTKTLAKPSIHRAAPPGNKPPAKPPANYNNKLLAGYLAREFLSKGTLFGEPVVDPARAEAVPLARTKPPEPAKRKPNDGGAGDDEKKRTEKQRRYVEVSDLLRTDGVHIPGIVNPAQLSRFLQLG